VSSISPGPGKYEINDPPSPRTGIKYVNHRINQKVPRVIKKTNAFNLGSSGTYILINVIRDQVNTIKIIIRIG